MAARDVPNSDHIWFWDTSNNQWAFLSIGANLAISGTTLNAADQAPIDADYLVHTANTQLTAERVVTDTPTITWNWGTAGQAKANNVQAPALQSATTTIDVSAATAPSAGQVLTAVDSTHATWQAASGGSLTQIYGLLVTQNSSTSIAVSAGSCYDPSSSTVITYAGGTNSPTLGASHFYAVYLYSNAGVATLDVQQEDPPSTAYAGTARQRASGHAGRYIGSFLTDGSSHIYAMNIYESAANQVMVSYLSANTSSPFPILSAGAATSYTSVTLAGMAPRYVTNEALLEVSIGSSAGVSPYALFSLDGTNRFTAMRIYDAVLGTNDPIATSWLPVNPSTPNFYYLLDAATSNIYINCNTFKMAR